MTQSFTKSLTTKFTLLFATCLLVSSNIDAKGSKMVEENCTTEVNDNVETMIPVRGFVVDEFGEPMAGVLVLAKGSNKNAITNTDGKYKVLANEADILLFSQIGVSNKEEKITSSRIVNVALAMDFGEM